MTQELKDRLKAAYGEDRFTMTVSEISARAGTRRRRLLLQLATAAAVVLVVAAGALLQPRHHASPLTPLPTPSPSVAPLDWAAFTVDCLRGWHEGAATAPPLLAQRQKGDRGLLLYGDSLSTLTCVGKPGSSTKTLSNPDRKPLARTGFFEGFGATGDDGTHEILSGPAPAGATGIAYVDPAGKAYPGEIAGGVFFVWEPQGMASYDVTGSVVRVSFADSTTLHYSPGIASGLSQTPGAAEVRAWCVDAMSQLPVPTPKSSAPAEVYSRDLPGGGRAHLFADGETLVACRINRLGPTRWNADVDLSYRHAGPRAEPLEPLVRSHGTSGHAFGRAPEGAVTGQLRLSSGKTVPLSIKDGYYFAVWTSDDYDGAVSVRVDTATERWTHENGMTSRAAL